MPDTAALAVRTQLEALLAEDARLHPAFAMARKNAVLAGYEAATTSLPSLFVVTTAERFLRALHTYEAMRGGARTPSAKGLQFAEQVFSPVELSAYERARHLSLPVYPPRPAPPADARRPLDAPRFPAGLGADLADATTAQLLALQEWRPAANLAAEALEFAVRQVSWAVHRSQSSIGMMLRQLEDASSWVAIEGNGPYWRRALMTACRDLCVRITATAKLDNDAPAHHARLVRLVESIPVELIPADVLPHRQNILSWKGLDS